MLGEKVRGFDRDFFDRSAQRRTARSCWEKSWAATSRSGHRRDSVAVRQQQNIRPLNVHVDSDDIVRRLPLSFTVNGAKVPSMAVELASGRWARHPNSMNAAG